MAELGIAIIGTGKIALANHLPGVALSRRAKVVALCDSNPQTLAAAAQQTGISRAYADYRQAVDDPQVHAVVVATPNHVHPDVVLACARAKKHVLCEKPLALDARGAIDMLHACEQSGVRHMTAFTYRFVPAMRYTAHLVRSDAIGRPIHFRAQRFQDWSDWDLGWRQVRAQAGTGELGDMLSHRIDYAHFMIGPMKRVVAGLRNFVPVRAGKPSDVDDWAAMLVEFESGVTGVLESTKLATGRGEGYGGQDIVEINGTDATVVASTQSPQQVRVGRKGASDLETVPVPAEFLVWPGSPRDPRQGDPRVTFRYDQGIEFIDAIHEGRPCRPSLRAGVDAQIVMDAAVQSHHERRWVDVPYLKQPEE
jgi:predicted dehydrogenase